MTDPDLARLTAEMMGWQEYVPCGEGTEMWTDGHRLVVFQKQRHPCDSIEQAFMVQERIWELGLAHQYTVLLTLKVFPMGWANWCDSWALLNVTPRQRVEAAVAAWKGAAK